MATKFSNALQMTTTTDALFRAWAQFIDDTIVLAGGWVNTADTGQLTIASATHPSVANTKVGYRVYHMNDALQATKPVFLRVDYGSGPTAANPAVWFTIGTGSDGAGNITGTLLAATQMQAGSNATSACDSYGSADTNRLELLMFVRAGATDLYCISLERSKDATGADTGDGLMLLFQCGATGINFTQYVLTTPGTQPPQEAGMSVLLSNRSASAFNSNIGVGLPAFYKSYAQQPGLGVIFVNDGDYIAEAQPSMTFYGGSRTYQLGNSNAQQCEMSTGNGGRTSRSNTRIGIRYE
jgi:hypothetical protein